MSDRNFISGTVQVELTSADPERALAAINRAGITVYGAEQIGALSFRFTVERKSMKALRYIVKKRGETLVVHGRNGLYWGIRRLLYRPVLLFGLLIITLLSLYLPGKILFISVEGNSTVPSSLILEKAQDCGIVFGASRRAVRSEKMKNALLEALPQLQWAGVNTKGCCAVISVRERQMPEAQEQTPSVSSIVSSMDGVIRELTVVQGNPVCKVGQSVTAGQVLISGYTDLGLCIRAEQARGEIFAQTQRSLQVICPSEQQIRGEIYRQEKKYSVLIGKKRINFYKGSGISDTTCDKMYSYYHLTLPGGYQLPITFVVEELQSAQLQCSNTDSESAKVLAAEFASRYLSQKMVAGRIEARYELLFEDAEHYRMTGKYACYEMIGRSRNEENFEGYEAS